MRALVLATAGVALVLSACVAYAPAPVKLEAYPDRRAVVRLDALPDGRAWTAEDLLAAALRNNPAVAEAAAKHRTARAAAKASHVPPSATLTLTAEYARSEPKPWLYAGASDIPLDVGGRRKERNTAADLAVLRALHDYGEAVWTVRTALARARTERLYADEEIALAGEVEAVRQARVDRLDRRVAAGEDDRSLALTARSELETARRHVTDARGRRAAADAALATALGVPVAAVRNLRLAAVTAPPATLDVPAAARVAALTRRDVLRAVVDYDLAESALRLEVAKQYPEVHLGPGYTYDHGVAKLPFNLALTLPPRDLNRSAIAQAEAKRAEAGRSLEAVQAAVLSAIDAADAALTAARLTAAQVQARDIPNADALAAATSRSLAAGVADRVDELGARAAALETRLTFLDARKARALAGVDLEDALRAPFDPAELTLLETTSRTLGDAP
jgi:CRISPR system Cascade subunit CasA